MTALPKYFPKIAATEQSFRIASVPYLNALPLHRALGDGVEFFHPTSLARRLRMGLHDAALVPVAECLEYDGYRIVDGAAVGSDGPVFSVILGLHKPIEEVHDVMLDPASKTSAMMTRVLFKEHFQREVVYSRLGYEDSDATMLIGDQAIDWRAANPQKPIIDLGEAWQSLTGLPFVYAVWAIRRELPRPRAAVLAGQIRRAAKEGLAMRTTLAKTHAQHRYLTENIQYDFANRQKEGLNRFAELAHANGLIDSTPNFEFI